MTDPLDNDDALRAAKEARAWIKQNGEEVERNVRQLALLYRISFRALTSEGFTPEQAIELLKARGWALG